MFFMLSVTLALSAKLTKSPTTLNTEYTVQGGDTLYTIARDHHTTVREVIEANNLSLNAVIKIGQTLKVPLNTYFPTTKTDKKSKTKLTSSAATPHLPPSPAGTVNHVVKSGETLFTIARAHHTSIKAVLEANNLDRNAVIKTGQNLIVPTNTYFPDKSTTGTMASRSSPAAPSTTTSTVKGTYVVGKGDTLFSIARKNHIIISKLMRMNGLGLTDSLRVGQILKVSASSTFAPKNLDKQPIRKTTKRRELPVGAMPSYTVKKGDTLWQIARKYHLTLAEIRKLNKMGKKDQIHTGMVLAVGKAVRPKSKTYKVKRGDTLWLIAKKYNMSTQKLRKLNHMRRKDRIHRGMILALSKDAVLPKATKTKAIIAKLKKKGAKRSEIEAVLAKVKRSKRKNLNIVSILAQVKRDKKKKQIETPLRITKKTKQKKQSRLGSAMATLNGHGRGSSGWSSSTKTIRVAKRYLGRRYVWGAVGPRSFDCSGFTQYVMRKSKGVRLPRVSRKQAYYGKYVSRSHLRPGDLVFFDTSRRRRGYVNHVGIYIGNHKFIHASSARHRVVITSLNRPFYSARFKWGRRVN